MVIVGVWWFWWSRSAALLWSWWGFQKIDQFKTFWRSKLRIFKVVELLKVKWFSDLDDTFLPRWQFSVIKITFKITTKRSRKDQDFRSHSYSILEGSLFDIWLWLFDDRGAFLFLFSTAITFYLFSSPPFKNQPPSKRYI